MFFFSGIEAVSEGLLDRDTVSIIEELEMPDQRKPSRAERECSLHESDLMQGDFL